jgi:N-acetylmuramoyl-L-alanine amidase
MTHRAAVFLGLVLLASVAPAAQAPTAPVEAQYADARAKERAVRAALTDPGATVAVLKSVRTVVSDYETIVRLNPRSEYSDDALWFAGWLSLDAFDAFGDEHERAAAIRLWHALAAQYPTSRLARQVPQQLAKTDAPKSVSSEPARPVQSPPPQAHVPLPQAPPPQAAPVPAAVPPPTSGARTAARSTFATLTGVRRSVLPDSVRVTIALDAEVRFHDERLENPSRVFVDLPSTIAAPDLVDRTLKFDGETEAVRQIRIGRHPNNTIRVVLDVDGSSAYSVYPLYSPFRLVIEFARRPPAALAVTRGANFASAPTADPPLQPAAAPAAPPSPTPLASTPVTPAATNATVSPPAANIAGGFSISRQLGLGVSRIVIDPGHGGHDPGATGKGLDVALRLEKLLAKVQGLEVILTRRTDDFVSLQERTSIANREGADLFLSIHANASGSAQAHGIETYFLNFAMTSSAAAVAARENAASGQPMAALPDFVKAIALHNKLDESKDFATYVQRAMMETLGDANKGVKDLGVKQAPFVVLIGAAMPSVLAEISFLTNPQEVKLLRSPAYRQKIAEALFEAVRRYQGALKTEAKVAQ